MNVESYVQRRARGAAIAGFITAITGLLMLFTITTTTNILEIFFYVAGVICLALSGSAFNTHMYFTKVAEIADEIQEDMDQAIKIEITEEMKESKDD